MKNLVVKLANYEVGKRECRNCRMKIWSDVRGYFCAADRKWTALEQVGNSSRTLRLQWCLESGLEADE